MCSSCVDMKIKSPVELFNPSAMLDYATLCGWDVGSCSRPLRRSRDDGGIHWQKHVFDKAVAGFSKAYTDQAEQDHAVFERAIGQGRIEAQAEC